MGIKFKVTKTATTIFEAFEHSKYHYMLQYYSDQGKPKYIPHPKRAIDEGIENLVYILVQDKEGTK